MATHSVHSPSVEAPSVAGRLSASRAKWLAWSLFAVVVAFVVIGVALYVLARPYISADQFCGGVAFVSISLPYAVVAALIMSRQPRNSVGWLLFIIALSMSIGLAALGYGTINLGAGQAAALTPFALLAAWVANWVTMPSMVAHLAIPLLFPTGRPPTPSWRWLVFAIGGLGLAVLICGMFEAHFSMSGRPNLANPIGFIPIQTVERLLQIFSAAVLGLFGLSVVSLFVRYRRAGSDERRQIKWPVYTIALILAWNLAGFFFRPRPEWTTVPGLLQNIISTLFNWAIPISIGIAILRYRLWDIDLLINRTLLYAALSAFVVGAYALIVGGLGALMGAQSVALVPALVATAVIALAFQPLRARLQRLFNRLIYGQRDEPYAVISHLGQQLGAAYSPDAVLPAIVRTVGQSLKLPYVALRTGDAALSAEWRASNATVSPSNGALERMPITHQAQPVGELIVARRTPGEALSSADRKLLDDLARQAGAAVSALRLTNDLQRSRERIVLAREEERRALRRDLHDGLGPMLANFAMQLDGARDALPPDAAQADALLADLTAKTQEGIGDIRRLVYGLRPPALDEFGLIAAINTLAAGTPHVLTTVQAPAALPALPAAVEVAAYRIAQEAVTNVVRHAGARVCVIYISVEDRGQRAVGSGATALPTAHGPRLTIEVTDDGIGLPESGTAGVGLRAMRERAEELGGTCTVEPVPSRGTQVVATLPLGVASTAGRVEGSATV